MKFSKIFSFVLNSKTAVVLFAFILLFMQNAGTVTGNILNRTADRALHEGLNRNGIAKSALPTLPPLSILVDPIPGEIYTNTENTAQSKFSNNIGNASKEVWYAVFLANETDLSVNTCGSVINNVIHVLDEGMDEFGLNPNVSCGRPSIQIHLPAGMYYVVCEGTGSTNGSITTNISISESVTPLEGSTMLNPINVQVVPGQLYSSTLNSSGNYGNETGQSTNDIFYKFTLLSQTEVSISNCGSSIDTYLHLMNENGLILESNDDNGPLCQSVQASIKRILPAGTYYAVSEGKSVNGMITTIIGFLSRDGDTVALSQNQNYVASFTPLQPFNETENLSSKTVEEVQLGVQYFDGLGRPLQTVQVKGSPNADRDLVTPFEYDAFGREAKKYLSYAAQINDGSYKANALNQQPAYFNSPGTGVSAIPSPFAETRFEPSPLNRVEEQGAPGNPWQLSTSGISGSGHTVKTEYGTNTASGERAVRLYYANVVTTPNEGYKRTLSSTGNYEASQLYLTVTKDENWTSGKAGTTEEYKDKQGQVVLKRTWKDESTPYSTYYVYDDFGDLSFVLPPGSEPDGGMDDTRLNKYGYQYRYDGRRRLIEKKIPGKDGWESVVYNKIDQVVLTQDPRQALSGKWNFTKYDGLGRVVMSGEYQNNSGRVAVQTLVDGITTNLWETYTGAGDGYNNVSFPTSYSKLLSVNYYDDYTFPGSATFGALPVARSSMTKSLLTGTKTNVLGTTTMLISMNFYDDDGRVMQVKSQNYRGGVDSVLTTYTFTDQPETVTRYHSSPSNNVTVKTRYQYDHMGRKTHTWESINNATEVLLVKNNYNEVGQLWKKELHNGLQTTTYTYNERGWLSGSSSPKFDLKLRYNQTTKGAPAQYNGNISEQEYTGDYSGNRWFTYQYDALNRLTTSAYNNSNLLGEQLVYDKMGNITSLTRGNYGTLGYVYDGNRLSSVSGFKAGSYGYDANGNATTDGTRGVTISYNELNLPSQVSGTGTASYTYDAAGNKLRSVQGGTTRDYMAGIQYTNGVIDFIQTEEGRAVRKSDGSYRYEYNLKDHLGNTRVVIDNNGNNTQRVVQEDEYYAFGLNVGKYTLGNKNNYLYNGKEKQDVLTDEYDYGARFYDPVIGRWTSVDPLVELSQENSSPYSYAFNNPLKFTDPDGRVPDITITGENNSSVTIKTNVIDINVDASPLGLDFGGNYTLAGNDILQAGLDIVGIFDPTGIADVISASISVDNGNWGDALISGLGIFPYAGDLAKVGKIEKDVKVIGNAIKDIKKGEKSAADIITHAGQKIDPKTGQKIGPSGKPMVHTVEHTTQKRAKDAAREGGKGTPVKHTKDKKGGSHYHHGDGVQGKGKGTKDYGSKAGKRSDNVHHEYPN